MTFMLHLNCSLLLDEGCRLDIRAPVFESYLIHPFCMIHSQSMFVKYVGLLRYIYTTLLLLYMQQACIGITRDPTQVTWKTKPMHLIAVCPSTQINTRLDSNASLHFTSILYYKKNKSKSKV